MHAPALARCARRTESQAGTASRCSPGTSFPVHAGSLRVVGNVCSAKGPRSRPAARAAAAEGRGAEAAGSPSDDSLADAFFNKKLGRLHGLAEEGAQGPWHSRELVYVDEEVDQLDHNQLHAEVHYVPLLQEGAEPQLLEEPPASALEERLSGLPGALEALVRQDLHTLDSSQALAEYWDQAVEPDRALPPAQRGAGLREYLYPVERPEDTTQWDLRARMDWFARMQKEAAAWDERRTQVRLKKSVGADWRTDVRIKHTSNPLDPIYREWSHHEIWELITLDGNGADPRDVPLHVEWPNAPADYQAEDARYQPEHIDWLEALGMVIPEEEESLIVDRDSEVALLASEFSDFDDDYLAAAPEGSEYIDDVSFDEPEGASVEAEF